MIKLIAGLVLMTVTFSFGWGLVNVFDRLDRSGVDEIRSLDLGLMGPQPINADEDPQYTQMLDALREGEFYAFGHACGNGFVTGFMTVGRKKLSHSFEAFDDAASARAGFSAEILSADEIIDGPIEVTRLGERVSRAFLRREGEDGRRFFEVIWIGKQPEGYTAIAGPDQTSTLKLEEYLIARDSR